jgi:hypothetical protein
MWKFNAGITTSSIMKFVMLSIIMWYIKSSLLVLKKSSQTNDDSSLMGASYQ